MKPNHLEIIFSIIGAIILIYIGFGVFLYLEQDTIMYQPGNTSFNNCPGFFDAKQVYQNGERFHLKDVSEQLVIFYHGNAETACERSFLRDVFIDQNYSYLYVEYPGYARNNETPAKERFYQTVQTINEITQNYSTIIVGESLGTGLASYHASLRPSPLILVMPYTSIEELAALQYPLYPVELFLKDDYSTELASNATHVLVIHGTHDRLIPLSMATEVFDRITSPKQFKVIGQATHNDIYFYQETLDAVTEFLQLHRTKE